MAHFSPMSAFVVAFIAAMVLTPAFIRAARRVDLVDVPNHRSSHSAPVARGGGVPLAVATLCGVVAGVAGRSVWTRDIGVLIAAAVALAAVGLLDDRRGLPPLPRLILQLVVPVLGAIALRSGAALLLSVVVAAVLVAGYVNAFNFMDGIDGISGSQAAIAGAVLAVIADDAGERALMLAGLAVTGASIGFLPYNAVRARVFLGDVGSYFLGVWLSGLALLLVDAGAPVAIVATPFVLYMGDTAWTLLCRARRGESLTQAHREHTYQRLVQLGYSHVTVAALCAVVVAVPSGVALLLLDRRAVLQYGVLLLALVSVAAYLALPSLVSRSSAHRSGRA
jgi:UDP-GlcNAc:undecaprenyl-phosphate/decaprenyl-phosphate GlcNAc-1-phosphate transferase